MKIKSSLISQILYTILAGCCLITSAQSAESKNRKTKPAVPKRPTQDKVATGSILDQLCKDLVVNRTKIILGYQIDQSYCILKINPSIWNSLNRGQQQQFGDMLAATNIWSEMKLTNARFMVYATEVGRIKPTWSGDYEFLLY